MLAPRVKATLGLAAGLAVLAGLVAYVGPGEVVRAVREASPHHLALAFLAYALFFLLRGVRWKVLLSRSAPDVTLASTTSLTAVGWLANSILPLKGGDVLRAALLARRARLGLLPTTASVALERVLDLLGLGVLASLALLLVPRATTLPPWLSPALQAAWALPLAAVVILIAMVRARQACARALGRALGRLGAPGRRLVHVVDTTLAGLESLLRRPALLALLAPLTMLVVVAQALVFAFLVMAFVDAPFALAFAGGAIFLLSFVVSVTPGNVGTYEAAFVAVFTAFSVAPEAAVPAAILTHLATTLIVAVLGGAAMFAMGADIAPQGLLRPARAPEGGSP